VGVQGWRDISDVFLVYFDFWRLLSRTHARAEPLRAVCGEPTCQRTPPHPPIVLWFLVTQMYFLICIPRRRPSASGRAKNHGKCDFFHITFVRVACTAHTSLDISMNVHGTWPQCAGTVSGRALCVRRGAGMHLINVPPTLYPHYGLDF